MGSLLVGSQGRPELYFGHNYSCTLHEKILSFILNPIFFTNNGISNKNFNEISENDVLIGLVNFHDLLGK